MNHRAVLTVVAIVANALDICAVEQFFGDLCDLLLVFFVDKSQLIPSLAKHLFGSPAKDTLSFYRPARH
jgi:hypothetical protein